MIRRILLVLCMWCVAIPGLLAENEQFVYNAKGKRDPMVPLTGQIRQETRSGVVKLEDVVSFEEILLEGIAMGPEGKRAAVLNGEMVRELETIGNVRVRKISKSEVEITLFDKVYMLNFNIDTDQ